MKRILEVEKRLGELETLFSDEAFYRRPGSHALIKEYEALTPERDVMLRAWDDA